MTDDDDALIWERRARTNTLKDVFLFLVFFWSIGSAIFGICGWWVAWGGTQILALFSAACYGFLAAMRKFGPNGTIAVERREE